MNAALGLPNLAYALVRNSFTYVVMPPALPHFLSITLIFVAVYRRGDASVELGVFCMAFRRTPLRLVRF